MSSTSEVGVLGSCAANCGTAVHETDPRLIIDGELWHFACSPIRARLGITDDCLPPISRKRDPAPAKPLSMDPEGIRQLRRGA